MRMLLLCAYVVALCSSASPVTAFPLPYPIPANISFGICGDLPSGVSVPGCTSSVGLAAKVEVQCSDKPGCDSGCAQSKFVQGVFARYEARLSGGGAPPPPPGAEVVRHGGQEPAHPEQPAPILGDHEQRYWWRLNNSNCNLHDMTDVRCAVAVSYTHLTLPTILRV